VCGLKALTLCAAFDEHLTHRPSAMIIAAICISFFQATSDSSAAKQGEFVI
jgi:hypothetical protein